MRSQEEALPCDGGGTVAQGAQRSCGCPIPGSVQGQVGHRALEQAALVEGVPACGRGWSWMSFKVPSAEAIPCLWDSMRGGCSMRNGPAPQGGPAAPPLLPRSAGLPMCWCQDYSSNRAPRGGATRRLGAGEAGQGMGGVCTQQWRWQSRSGVRVRGCGAGLGVGAEPWEWGWGCADPRGSGQWGWVLPGCWGVRGAGVSPGQ